jgi:hypothetical protein
MTGSAINLPIEEAAERYSKAEAEVKAKVKAKVETESAPQILASKRHSRATRIYTDLSIINYQ